MRRRPWPERAGEAQCLGGCLGKPGDCVSSPTFAPLRARVAGVNRPRAHGILSDPPRRRVAGRAGGLYAWAFRGLQAPGQTAIPSKRRQILALPRRFPMGGTPPTFPHSWSALRAGFLASAVIQRIQGISVGTKRAKAQATRRKD